MNQRYITLFLMCLALLSPAAAQTIEIIYQGDKADVRIPTAVTDVACTVSGAHVVFTSSTTSREYAYHVTGQTADGSLTINGSYKLCLQLDGARIQSQRGAAIDVECSKRIAVQLVPGTETVLEDCAGGLQKAALYFSGHPEFEGGGTLSVTGHTGHAIAAKEYLQLKKSLGRINVLGAPKDGIHCGKGKVSAWDERVLDDDFDGDLINQNEYFLCNGGEININNVGGDCIDADDYGCMHIKGGVLNLCVTSADAAALKASSTFILEDGQLSIDVLAARSQGIYAGRQALFQSGTAGIYVSGDGSKGIKGKQKATYPEGGAIRFEGTLVDVLVRGGDELTDPSSPSHCVGVSADGNLHYQTGRVTVTTVGQEARAVTCDAIQTGLPINVQHRQWYVRPHDYRYDMTLYAVLPASDYGSCEIAAFVGDECRGLLQYNGQGKYGYMRIYSNQAIGEALSFRLYDSVTGQVSDLTNSLSFVNGLCQGTASNPIMLMRGDDDSRYLYNVDSRMLLYDAGTMPDTPAFVDFPLVQNGSMEGDDLHNFIVCVKGDSDRLVEPQDGVGRDGSRGVRIVVPAKVSDDWDTQFFIHLDEPIPPGQSISVSFDYRASEDMYTAYATQCHAAPHDYIHWACIGNPVFKTEWQTYHATITVDATMSPADKLFQTIAFNLAVTDHPVTIYIDNVHVTTRRNVQLRQAGLSSAAGTPLHVEPLGDGSVRLLLYDQQSGAWNRLVCSDDGHVCVDVQQVGSNDAWNVYDQGSDAIEVANASLGGKLCVEPASDGGSLVLTHTSTTRNRWLLFTAQEYAAILADDTRKCWIGDANRDGELTIADVQLLARYVAGLEARPADITLIDVNADGRLTIADVATLIAILRGQVQAVQIEQ